MKKTLLALMICFLSFASFAQSNPVIHFELGGPGIASFNFDARFTKSNGGIGGRIGIGGATFDGDGQLFIPLQVNYLLGKDNKNFFEVGGGVTFVSHSYDYYYDDDVFGSTFGHLWFGYRLQPPKGGFSFRAGICPVFASNYFIPYYAGLSFGYKF